MIILANIVWPALYILARQFTWWAIALSLVIEFVALRVLATGSWRRVFAAVVVGNFATAVLGYLTLPWITMAWEYALHLTVYQLIEVGAFNPFAWVASIVIISAFSAFGELLVISRVFKMTLRRKGWIYWWLANAATVAVAFITTMIWPVTV